MPPVKSDPTFATYDFRNPKEAALFHAREIERMRRNIADKLKDLEAKGIVDEHGHPLRSDIPPDMQSDSGADVGG